MMSRTLSASPPNTCLVEWQTSQNVIRLHRPALVMKSAFIGHTVDYISDCVEERQLWQTRDMLPSLLTAISVIASDIKAYPHVDIVQDREHTADLLSR